MSLKGDLFMNKYVEIIAIVEGTTERVFINSMVRKYLITKNISIKAIDSLVDGDVRFNRNKNDIINSLCKKNCPYVTTFIDYYGIKEWPGVKDIPIGASPIQIASIINEATKEKLIEEYPTIDIERRFIPFIAVHEFEALLFSDCDILIQRLKITDKKVQAAIRKCKEPESINDGKETAPSKRLEKFAPPSFTKTGTGIAIAEAIGIDAMRQKCPNFNAWISSLENLAEKCA